MKYNYALIFVFIFIFQLSNAQNAFSDEVASIKLRDEKIKLGDKTIVFTGSSSIRMWKNLDSVFNNNQIINTGFGGSTAKDLLVFQETLIERYQPKQVFIYEGDNDLFAGKSPRSVLRTIKKIIKKIHSKNKQTQIVLIGAKPSISRWSLKKKYEKLNAKFEKLCAKIQLLTYADVWRPMLEEDQLKKDLFIEDGLHMNGKGYEIWKQIVSPLLLQ